jgi:hypothetical protein
LPHSEIRGSTGARPSPRLFAACHVLHRLSVPRHPPDALHVLRPRPAPSTRFCAGSAEVREQRTEIRGQTRRRGAMHCRAGRDAVLLSVLCDLSSELCAGTNPAGARAPAAHTHAQARPHLEERPRRMMAGPASRSRLASRFPENRGQRSEDRPDGPPRHSPSQLAVLDARRPTRDVCPLISVLCHLNLVGLGRFERPTSRLSGVRSDQLSYRPKIRDQRTESR